MSKYRREEPTTTTKHKHCPVCGTPIDMGKEFCSDKCKGENRRTGRARTRNFLLITGAVVFFYVVFLILQFR